MKSLILLALLLPLAVGAQVKKCTIDGKIVYSDSQCGQHGTTVNATPNSIDTSAIREQAAKDEIQEKRASAVSAASAKKSENERFKQRHGLNGPCPGLDHEAYLSCMKSKRKPIPLVR